MTYKIDRLFGSKTRVSLLSKLMMNPGKSFYLRELARELKIPYSMLYKEEKNLVRLGILLEEKRGKTTLVSVNRDLPYLAELKGLMTKTAGLGDLLKTALLGLEGVRFAVIYGSFASGECSESSDVDLLIVGDVDEEELLKRVRQVENQVGKEINYVLWSQKEFISKIEGKHHLLTNIVNGPIIMLIGGENELRRAVEEENHQAYQTRP